MQKLASPAALARFPDGRLLVADPVAGKVFVYYLHAGDVTDGQ
jgi:hypothetical protein